MLDGGVNTLLQSAGYSISCHIACQNAVFGEVLIVTGRKGGAVHIHSRCVPAGGTEFLSHFAHQLAPLLSQLMAPGAGDYNFNRVSD